MFFKLINNKLFYHSAAILSAILPMLLYYLYDGRLVLAISFNTLLLFYLTTIVKPNLVANTLVCIVLTLLSVNNTLIVFSAVALHSDFTTSVALNILTASTTEVKTALTLYIPYFVFAILYNLALYYTSKKLRQYKYSKLSIYGILCLTIVFFTYKATRAYQIIQAEKQIGIVPTTTYCISRYLEYGPLQTLSAFYEASQYLSTSKEHNAITYPKYTLTNKEIQNIIVIIGESVQRDALQLYNNNLTTTPYSKQRENQMYVYTEAIAPSAYTNTSIALMLSDQVPTNQFATSNFANNIIALANSTEQWTTYWLSNQEHLSRFSTFYTIQTQQAQNAYYTNATYDQALLPFVKQAIQDNHKKRLLFIHLQGSHFNAKDRYPASFDVYKQYQPFENEYYNSIRYTDYIIEEIIKTVEHTPSVVLYIADHAQDVINKQFVHAFTPKGLQVPFFIWNSSTLDKSLYKTGTDTTPISTTQLYNILTEYMGIEGLPQKDSNKELRVLNPQLKVQAYETLKE